MIAAWKGLDSLDPAATNVQVFNVLAQGMFAWIRQRVLVFERDQAAKTAADAATPVDMQ